MVDPEDEYDDIENTEYDGISITDQFISLVNPQIEIQPFVKKLTIANP